MNTESRLRDDQLRRDVAMWPAAVRAKIDSGNADAVSVLASYREFVFRGEFDHLGMFVDPTKVCVDIGTNKGQYALKLAGMSQGVLCVEPSASLQFVRELLPGNCVFRGVAAGRDRGRAVLRIPTINGWADLGQSTLSPDNTLGGNPYQEQQTEVWTIDALINDVFPQARVGFVKIDVEGFEDAVLAGSVELLRSHRPNVQVEIHGDVKIPAIHQFMAELGFRGVFFFEGRLYDGSTFTPGIHRTSENEYNRRTKMGLNFDPAKFVCDFFFIPVSE